MLFFNTSIRARQFLNGLVFSLGLVVLSLPASADVKISLPEPNWAMSFKPLASGGSNPKLKTEEFPIIDAIRPLLDKKQYSRANTQLKEHWPSEPSAALLYVRAQVLTQLKQYSQAEKDYLKSIKLHGDYMLASQSLAGLALSQNQAGKARQYLAQTIALGGASADLFGQLGYLNLREHSAFSSVAAYQRAYALAPENKHWQKGLLMALSQSRSHLQANSLIDELLRDDPNNRELWLHKANAAIAAEQKNRALTAMEMAYRLGEKQKQNLQLLAQLNVQSGNISRAVHIAKQSPSLLKDYGYLGPMLEWLASHGHWNDLATLIQASKAQSKQYRSVDLSHWSLQRAKLAANKGQSKRQASLLQQALKHNPANGDAILDLAQLRIEQGQLSRADILLSRAASMDNSREAAWMKRAQVAYLQKRYKAAQGFLQNILKLDPSRRDLIANMDILQRLIRQQNTR
ncbi:tetratricopeptide repeat protein [Pseudoteredinibacter isoporae]|uniref:Tetratricopeptide (TPR) repeat protein n=1 Tax=Pseudoteredinibacter isoporae TaxID=570281 RepID=A0A7X0JYI2_9GAMM|nr:tetratricopeptide repeat protein [Pseudoteredinibacter isoporae]MBB6523596.1 tetratricopeptide (TPR) repeat protein [Pseudoteredinibacter isoporae]NHO89103.1 tetratricopeptide repeat protein [Pseudoteredinibacter isoporae]NIB22286.1 tetratricopeptide repeat protein [Pseudoteredinibacter isoporae]